MFKLEGSNGHDIILLAQEAVHLPSTQSRKLTAGSTTKVSEVGISIPVNATLGFRNYNIRFMLVGLQYMECVRRWWILRLFASVLDLKVQVQMFSWALPRGPHIHHRLDVVYHLNQFIGHASPMCWHEIWVVSQLMGPVCWTVFSCHGPLKIVEKWVEDKKIVSPLNCSAVWHLFVYETWLGTSHSQLQAYWMKISDVSWSQSQAVKLMNLSCIGTVTIQPTDHLWPV